MTTQCGDEKPKVLIRNGKRTKEGEELDEWTKKNENKHDESVNEDDSEWLPEDEGDEGDEGDEKFEHMVSELLEKDGSNRGHFIVTKRSKSFEEFLQLNGLLFEYHYSGRQNGYFVTFNE